MIGTIAGRELHDNLLTFRFLFGTLVLLVLVAVVTLVDLRGLEEEVRDSRFASDQAESELRETRVYGQLKATALLPPEPLSVLSQGVAGRLGNGVTISVKEVPAVARKFSQENPLLGAFPSLDLALVYKIVISLLAMLFSYDAICGEKERGVLRLLLAQRASRLELILGKFLGQAGTMAVSLVLSLGIAALLMAVSRGGGAEVAWARLLLFGLTAGLYVAVFLALGLVVSAVAHRPAQALVYCLMIWIALVVVWPNLSGFAASSLRPVPAEKTLDDRIRDIRESYAKVLTDWRTANAPKSGWSVSGWTGTEDVVLLSGDEGAVDYYRRFVVFLEPTLKKRADEIWAARRDYDANLTRQERLAAALGRLSPAGLFDEAAEIAAGTDLRAYRRFISQAVLYRESVFRYLLAKDAVHSLRYFTVMEEKDLLPLDEYRKRVEPRKPDGTFYEEKDYPPLSLEDLPRFSYRPQRLGDVLPRALGLLLVLALLDLALLLGASAAFARYDVR